MYATGPQVLPLLACAAADGAHIDAVQEAFSCVITRLGTGAVHKRQQTDGGHKCAVHQRHTWLLCTTCTTHT